MIKTLDSKIYSYKKFIQCIIKGHDFKLRYIYEDNIKKILVISVICDKCDCISTNSFDFWEFYKPYNTSPPKNNKGSH